MDENGDLTHRRNVASNEKTSASDTPTSSASASSSASSSASTPPQTEITSPNSEYCKQLENWLWQCYWHRSLAVSAYFTALNQNYGTTSSTSAGSTATGQQPGRQPPAPGFRINFNVFANQRKILTEIDTYKYTCLN